MARRALVPGLVLLALALGAALWWAAARGRSPATRVDAPGATSAPGEQERRVAPLVGEPLAIAAEAPLDAPATDDEREAIVAPRSQRNELDPRDRRAPPATLRIRVMDELGAPIERFHLEYHALEDPDGARVRDVEQADGTFAAEVHAGTWVVFVSAVGHLDSSSGRPILQRKVELPFFEHELPLVLQRAASLQGRVLDPRERPVAAALVSLSDRLNDEFLVEDVGPKTLTDVEGRFEFAALEPVPSAVTASAEGFAPSAPTELELRGGERLEVELRVCVGGVLHGEVLDEGEPAPRVDLGVLSMQLRQPARTKTDDLGRFELVRLTPGEYQVVAELHGPDGRERFEFATATVEDGQRTHVVLGARAAQPVRVTGLVTQGGTPFGGFDLMVLREDSPLFAGLAQVRVQDDGRFALELDGPGSYVFLADDEPLVHHVEVPPVRELELALEVSAGRIGGVVRGPDGPIAQANVQLTSDVPLLSIDGPQTTKADDAGRYAFERLPPGRYAVAAGGGRPEIGRAVLAGLELAPNGAIDDAHLDLGRGLKLRGRVVDAQDRLVAEASVSLQAEDGTPLEDDDLETDAAGRFASGYLSAEEVRVVARSASGVSPSLATRLDADTEEVVLRIAPGATAIVVCRDAQGRPLRAMPSFQDERGFEHAGPLTERDVARLFSSGLSSSTFTLGPLAPGRYVARARAADGRSARLELELEAGEERRVELVLE